MITVEYPLTLPSLANARLHWRSKAALVRRQRATTWLGIHSHFLAAKIELEYGPAPLAHERGNKLVVTLTRCAPRRIRDEHDNLRTAGKHVIDEVAAYFGIDDSDARIEWRYAQEKSATSSVRLCFVVEKKSPTERGDTSASRNSLASKHSDASGRSSARRRGAVSSTIRNREAK